MAHIDYLQVAKLRLGLTDTSYDDLLNSYISQFKQEIVDYCNLDDGDDTTDDFPEGLDYTLVDMVVDVFKADTGKGSSATEVSRGDTTIKYNSLNIAEVLRNYTVKLNRYRKLRTR